jgi:hypothetical protein
VQEPELARVKLGPEPEEALVRAQAEVALKWRQAQPSAQAQSPDPAWNRHRDR